MKLHRGIPYLPALIAHPGFRTSAALQQAVSITTEEKKKKTWEVVRSSMQGWSVWPPEVHQVSWTPQLPPGSGQTPETSLLPQAETFFEDKSQPPPPPSSYEGNLNSVFVWTEMRNSALRCGSTPSHKGLMPFSSTSQLIFIHYPFAAHPLSPRLSRALIDLIALSRLTRTHTHTPSPEGPRSCI